MITIGKYFFPKTLEEAYGKLRERRNNAVIGGGAYLKLGSKAIGTAVDLSSLNLDYIDEKEEGYEIGAMTTFAAVMLHKDLNKDFNNLFQRSIEDIVGMQLKNMVTVGATVYSRYGFSDFLTALLATDTEVKLFKAGWVSLEEFLEKGPKERDIVEKIWIKKEKGVYSFQDLRGSSSDYSILNLALSKVDNHYQIALGARPGRATPAVETAAYLSGKKLSEKEMEQAGEILAEELVFGTNGRGTKEYRRAMGKVLLKKALQEVSAHEN
ncbi:FAD binding domain-containing protein [Isachenkonia alkalipeptolytica]|uniref:FAD-binding protein n=1 Tax=Isachenkonia alkalipeptolytica TaxID=2565777 RepID=A0AA43XLW5_9CLOT|nr:FAD binding domain-containing protein [Isachenkonia alkalipeptolytica]NBG88629.1 FAD-binding protein [Isachenkonia alkalipeptolytica]